MDNQSLYLRFTNDYLPMPKEQKCPLCKKIAHFKCSRCEEVFYCSKEHQIQHWKKQHKAACCKKQNVQKAEDISELYTRRYSTRKNFYEKYSSKQLDLCVLDAKVMVDIQRKIKAMNSSALAEYEYGATVCLLCRSYILIQDKNSARIIMKAYLHQKQSFLVSFDNMPSLNEDLNTQNVELFQHKMNLISTIANICYCLELNCIKYYVLYTKNIEKLFGSKSYEASNCYFLLGCYFAEQGHLKKSISCFIRSAESHDQFAGDCYFNIGILYTYQNRFNKALKMLQIALEERNKQHGQDKPEIAQVQENIGMIYTELNDFITAIAEYEKAFKIRSVELFSAEYENVKSLIQDLFDKLSFYIASEHSEISKPSIFEGLRSRIIDTNAYWVGYQEKREKIIKERLLHQENPILPEQVATNKKKGKDLKKKDGQKASMHTRKLDFSSGGGSGFMFLSEQLMMNLNSTELYMLSELQMELESCTSLFNSVTVVEKSKFLKSLEPQNLKQLEDTNQVLFELIRLENIKINYNERLDDK